MVRPSIIAFILLICFNIHASNIILEGIVYDAIYKMPIVNAEVYIEETHVGTTTNNAGEFRLSIHDSLSHHNIIVLAYGYLPMQAPVDIIKAPKIEIFLEIDYREAIHKTKAEDLFNKALTFVMNDWVPLGNKEKNKFDFGRLQTIPTMNPIEGIRLRGGIASNSRLSPHFFMKGYVAYGFKDQKLKYRGEAIYSINKKEYHDGEFPKNNISIIYEDDIYSPGEMHPRAMNDLLLVTYRRSKDETAYRKFAEINYDREHENGFRYTMWLRNSFFTPQGNLQFYKLSNNESYINEIRNSEVGASLLWTGNKLYSQEHRKRTPLNLTAPLILLSHSIGIKNFIGGENSYHRSEISIQKRFEVSDIITIDVVGEAVKVWSQVSFPLLVYQNQRHRLSIENNAFFLGRSLEFAADQQATLRAVLVGRNLWLNKVPFLKTIGVKELLSFRASYGSLSTKNIPTIDNGLFAFPNMTHEYEVGVPYIEGTIGITNILGLLRLEYVHRFNYRKYPGAILGAVRIDIII